MTTTTAPAPTTIPICRINGCKKHQMGTFSVYGADGGKVIAPLNIGICAAHASSMPLDLRKAINAAANQMELDAVFDQVRAREWEPHERPTTWWNQSNNEWSST